MNGHFKILIAIGFLLVATIAESSGNKRNRWNMRFLSDPPENSQAGNGGGGGAPSGSFGSADLHCRPGTVFVTRKYEDPTASIDLSGIAVGDMANGATATVNCVDFSPKMVDEEARPVSDGTVSLICQKGAVSITAANCSAGPKTPLPPPPPTCASSGTANLCPGVIVTSGCSEQVSCGNKLYKGRCRSGRISQVKGPKRGCGKWGTSISCQCQ